MKKAGENKNSVRKDRFPAFGKIFQRERYALKRLWADPFIRYSPPPWNRCSLHTLKLLIELNYSAVSGYRNSLPPVPGGLVDFQTHVDLHTRKDIGWGPLFTDLRNALSSGICGVMIHHGKMNDRAFRFLEILLKCIQSRKQLTPVHFKELKQLLS